MSKDWTPSDRDYAIRTLVGEAANEPDEGLAAAAYVIANRARSGQFGGTRPTEVVLARGQFEPWQTRRDELLSLDDKHPSYARAAKIWDDVVSNPDRDPTSGATHFLNEDVVIKRSGKLPKWASGGGQKIGAHTFYGGKAASDDDIFDRFDPDRRAASAPAASTPDDIFDKFEPKAATATPSTGRPRVVIPTSEMSNTQRMVDSAPIIGPIMNNLTSAVSAGVIDPLVDAGSRMMGGPGVPWMKDSTLGERFSAHKAANEASSEKYSEENPKKALAADVAGQGLLFGPMSAIPAGARMLGAVGTSLGTKVLQGTGGMAAIEYVNQLLRGKDPREQGLTGPVPIAAATGAAGPIIGEAVGHVGQKVLDALPRRSGPLAGTNSVAREKMTTALSGETPASIQEAKEGMGRAGMMMDTNQGTRDIAGGLADIPGPHKETIRESLRIRAQETPQRLAESLDQNTVPHVDTAKLVRGINDARDETVKPLYDAFRATKVHPTDEIKALFPRLEKAGAFKLADELAGISGRPTTEGFFTTGANKNFPTAETWDLVKRGLDRRIASAIDGGDKELYRELVKLKKDVLREVEKTEGGKIWKKAREAFAEHSEIVHQLEEGQKTFSRATRADELAQELSLLSYNERAARQQGARDAVQQIIDNSVRGDTTARNTMLTKAGREKLELLFGKKKADTLIKDLEAELKLATNKQEIMGNSETSSKTARRQALEPQRREPGYLDNINLTKPSTLVPEWMTPTAMMEGMSGARHARAYEQLAKFMNVKVGTPEYDALVAAVMAEGARRGAQQSVLSNAGTGAGLAVQSTAPALRNRLLRPPEARLENGERQ